MKKFVALKNISFYGKLVSKDTVVEMEDAKAKIFLEKGFIEELKNEALLEVADQTDIIKEGKKGKK
ncbi:MAG: hypothetical protein SPI03_03680 [Campylobacter sputorum]|uniref:hypothetical protein n=1 Tax=Campylobacter sputorum TaxID=206 RepID=UPI002A92085A|nr:hypothetical protein [Campylobacter sputorum]MDY6120426.1 hypothetical protein [Campylobacter sputorum]